MPKTKTTTIAEAYWVKLLCVAPFFACMRERVNVSVGSQARLTGIAKMYANVQHFCFDLL